MCQTYTFIYLFGVACHPDHIEYTVFFGKYVFGIDAAYVGHSRQFYLNVRFSDNPFQVILSTKFPCAVFITGEILLGRFVSNLHIVNPGM